MDNKVSRVRYMGLTLGPTNRFRSGSKLRLGSSATQSLSSSDLLRFDTPVRRCFLGSQPNLYLQLARGLTQPGK